MPTCVGQHAVGSCSRPSVGCETARCESPRPPSFFERHIQAVSSVSAHHPPTSPCLKPEYVTTSILSVDSIATYMRRHPATCRFLVVVRFSARDDGAHGRGVSLCRTLSSPPSRGCSSFSSFGLAVSFLVVVLSCLFLCTLSLSFYLFLLSYRLCTGTLSLSFAPGDVLHRAAVFRGYPHGERQARCPGG